MAEDLDKLYSKFPSLMAQNMKCTRFSWLRRLGNSSFIIHFECPNFPAADHASISGDGTFLFILESSNFDINSVIKSSNTVEDILDNINHSLEDLEKRYGIKESQVKTESLIAVEAVVDELNQIGSERVRDVDESMTRITLISPDYDDDEQELTLHLSPDYPDSPVTVSHLLPASWQPPVASLTHVYKSWVSALQFYSPSWRQLGELDRLCWVLDPVPPTPAHLYR